MFRCCYISTHAPLAGRDPRPRPRRGSTKISTHAPLAGRDRRGLHREEDNYYFNPRAPCGARLWPKIESATAKAFQPTRPLRGATRKKRTPRRWHVISTHAPLAGRDRKERSHGTHDPYFNPRAPCGARHEQIGPMASPYIFQPTRPLRGATRDHAVQRRQAEISTHAPLAGRDKVRQPQGIRERNHFNPRAPCGARHRVVCGDCTSEKDISTHAPLAGRDVVLDGAVVHLVISTHAPLAGRDVDAGKAAIMAGLFQPTRPLRGATPARRARRVILEFQPTRPLRGATVYPLEVVLPITISTHAPLAGRDGEEHKVDGKTIISTHAPLAGRDSKSVQITMHIFAITDKFQMLLHRMPPVRAFCSFLTQENHADLGANRPSDLCALVLRTIRSSVPRADTSACSRSVRFYSRTSCPSSKIEGCPFLGQ